jgi:hypothetical protein
MLWPGWGKVCKAGIGSSDGDGKVLLPVCVCIFGPQGGYLPLG